MSLRRSTAGAGGSTSLFGRTVTEEALAVREERRLPRMLDSRTRLIGVDRDALDVAVASHEYTRARERDSEEHFGTVT